MVHQHTEIRDLSLKIMVVSLSLLLFQGVWAFLTGSLVLITDTLHLMGDNGVILIAIVTQVVVGHHCLKEEDHAYHGLEIVMTFCTGAILLFSCFVLALESIARLDHPQKVTPFILIPGVIGLLGNVTMLKLAQTRNHHLTVSGMVAHIQGDSLGSVAVIVTGIVIWLTGMQWVDPVLSWVVILLIVLLSVSLIRQGVHEWRHAS